METERRDRAPVRIMLIAIGLVVAVELVLRVERALVILVCCRDVSWRKTFCGEDGSEINPAAQIIRTMCIDEAESMHPGWLSSGGILCPVDGNRCPDVDEIDLRIERETS